MEETLTLQQMLVRGWTKPLVQRWLSQYAANQPIAFPVSIVQEAEQLPAVQMRLEEIRAQRKITPQVFANQPTPLGKNLEDFPPDTDWTLITSHQVRQRGWSKRLIRKFLMPRAYDLTPNGPRPEYFLAEVERYEEDPTFQGLMAEIEKIRQSQAERPGRPPSEETKGAEPAYTKPERADRTSRNRQQFIRNKQRAIRTQEQQDHNHKSLAKMMSGRPEKGGPLWSS